MSGVRRLHWRACLLAQVLGAIGVAAGSTAARAEDDAYECRKSYVTEFCTGTMMVALMKAQQGGKPDLVKQMQREWETASAIYKGTVVFDEEARKVILKSSFDGFSLDTVGGCIGRNEEGFKSIASKAFEYCEGR